MRDDAVVVIDEVQRERRRRLGVLGLPTVNRLLTVQVGRSNNPTAHEQRPTRECRGAGCMHMPNQRADHMRMSLQHLFQLRAVGQAGIVTTGIAQGDRVVVHHDDGRLIAFTELIIQLTQAR